VVITTTIQLRFDCSTSALFDDLRHDRAAALRSKWTRSSADADNGLDAFSGQSRSTNMVPFWVHCDFSLSLWSAPTD